MIKNLIVFSMLFLLVSCQPHRSSQKEDARSKPMRGDYWLDRYTYPTQRFDPEWYTRSRIAHKKNTSRTPVGQFSKNKKSNLDVLNTESFTALGPKPLNGGGSSKFSGRVNVIVTHPTDPSIAYIGVDGGGVWQTSDCCDSNTNWVNVTNDTSINGNAIGDLYIDPNNADIIYAGTGDLRYGSYSFGSAGLLRSKNAGASWELLGEAEFSPYRNQPPGEFPQYQAIGRVRTNPNQSEHIVVGTKTGIFFSYDDGVNWVGPCLTNSHTTQRQDTTGLEVSALGEIYAAIGTRGHNTPVQPDLNKNGANGIYKTNFPTAGCPVWDLITSPLNGWPAGTGEGFPFPNNSLGRIDIAMAPSDNDYIYAQVANVTTREVLGVWRTTDAGNSWSQVATTSDIGGCFDGGNQAWYDMGMSIAPNNPNEIFLSAVDLFKSTNGGNNFINSTCGYVGGSSGDFVHVDHHARVYVANDPKKLLVGTDGGVFFTNNADEANPQNISYTQLNNSINTIEFYSGDISANFATSDIKHAIGGAQDNGSSVASWDTSTQPLSATQWQAVNGGDGIYAAIEPINNQRVYVESQFGNMRISTSGINGSYFNSASPWSNDSVVPFIFPFHLNKHDCTTICEQLMAGTNRIWETTTGGLNDSSWYVNSPDLTKGVLQGRSIINQMHYGISDASVAVVGTNDGNVQFGFDMGNGTANSATWVDVTDGNTILPNRPILDVVTAADFATTAYAVVGGFDENTPATPGHIFEVICNADCSNYTWENKSGNLPNIPADSVMVNPNIPGMVFVGTDWGLYYTNDIKQTTPEWFRFTEGLPSVMIWDMTIDRGATTLAVFTRSRGAYTWPLPTSIIINDIIYKNGFE